MAQLELDEEGEGEVEESEASVSSSTTGGSGISSSAGSGISSPAAAPPSPPLSLTESTEQLARLEESRASGAITADEYEKGRHALLARALGDEGSESGGGSRRSKRPVSERTEARDLVEMMLAQFD